MSTATLGQLMSQKIRRMSCCETFVTQDARDLPSFEQTLKESLL